MTLQPSRLITLSAKTHTLRSDAHMLEPSVRIGKNGVTPGIITEIQKHLKKYKLIKVKMLKATPADRTTVTTQLETQVPARVVSYVGGVITLTTALKSAKSQSEDSDV